MDSIKIALYDETGYVQKLQEYMEKKKHYFWDIIRFSGREKLETYVKKESLDVLVLGEEALENLRDVTARVKQTIVLSEGMLVKEPGEYPVVFKYQSAEEVVREIKKCIYANQAFHVDEISDDRKKMTWIGLLSLGQRKDTSDFGRNLGRTIARERETLYLDFSPFPGMTEWSEDSQGMSELIFYVKQRKKELAKKIRQLVTSRDGFSCVHPVADCRDLFALNQDDIDFLLQSIMSDGGYEVVIVELPVEQEIVWRMFSACDRMYLLTPENEWDRKRQSALKHVLSHWSDNGSFSMPESVEKSQYPMIAESV